LQFAAYKIQDSALASAAIHHAAAPNLSDGAQIASRNAKHVARDAEDYAAVYTRTAELLAAALPIVCPPDAPPGAYDDDDTAAGLAMRGAEAAAAFATNGHLSKLPVNAQRSLLEQLALLLGSGHVPLAALVLPCWRKLVQAHERRQHRSACMKPSPPSHR
jgi:hypothetical protein